MRIWRSLSWFFLLFPDYLSEPGYFFLNWLPKGNVGELVSAGILPLYNIFVGIEVASSILTIFLALVIFKEEIIGMIVYLLCFILFLVGLYGVITRRNLIKIAISLSVMEFSTFLLLALVGYVDGGVAPIVDPANPVQKYVDPLATGNGTDCDCNRTCHNGDADGYYYQALQKIRDL